MTIEIKEGKEMDSRIHHFIENLVGEYGYIITTMEWKIEVERLPDEYMKPNTPRVVVEKESY